MSTLRLTSARPALRASGPAFRLSQTSVRRGAPLVRAMEGEIATLVGGITLGGLTGAALGALNGRVSTLETGGSASSSSSSASAVRPVTKAEVLEVQKNWAAAIAGCSKIYKDGGDYIGAAQKAAGDLYAYGHSDVLFKPTKAREYPFRPTAGEAMSYFVGGKVVDNGYDEDGGFAINGGKGWASCVYKNHKIELVGGIGIAMGTYDFTDATDGSVSTVEYTFGYRRCDDGKVRIFLHHSSVPYGSGSGPAPVTEAEVLEVQKNWAGAIAACSKIYKDNGDYIGAAGDAASQLYAYGHSNVLFKPTKAAQYPFRPTAGEAMSYFVGGKVIEGGYDEDGGFAINGGKGWASCVYKNHKIELVGGIGIAMGTYDFTDATDGSVSTVEYTFGYRRCDDGKVRIFLHHSSVPYGSGSGPAPVTEAEVLDVQKNWAAAIAGCSKIHKEGGDYIGAAAEAAGELYAYGHSNVLFKPTKAAEYPFRPTAEEAMSYFVGGGVVDNGYDEDGGFAINGGKGWKSCVYKNHQVELKGGIGIAMGTYDFTCATTGDVSTVEYTFGYCRCDDGKVRIFLHHSSVPYNAGGAAAPAKKGILSKVMG